MRFRSTAITPTTQESITIINIITIRSSRVRKNFVIVVVASDVVKEEVHKWATTCSSNTFHMKQRLRKVIFAIQN